GFEPGDIITKFDGQKVVNTNELQQLVERVPLDAKRDVEVLRDGKPLTLHVVPKALPKDLAASVGGGHPGHSSGDSKSFEASELGVEVAELTADQAQELGIKGETGVVITQVDPEKPAFEEGLREGMVILKVAKKTVKNVTEFKAALKDESLKDGIMLYVQTRNGKRFVVLKE
ncbi:MAG TPA: PDZ domain-containing protein, partial [Pirellulales bacterium]|nr:PDZ domain-containing protein [Pirellulales bacterium]